MKMACGISLIVLFYFLQAEFYWIATSTATFDENFSTT